MTNESCYWQDAYGTCWTYQQVVDYWKSYGYDYTQMVKPQEQKTVAAIEQPKNFEQWSKLTVDFIGNNYGYSPILVILIASIVGKKHLTELVKDPRQTLKKWANKL